MSLNTSPPRRPSWSWISTRALETPDNFPHAIQRYIKYDGKRYDLTPTEYQALQKSTGLAVAARFRSISPSMDDEAKIKRMTKILEDEGSRARKRFLREKKVKIVTQGGAERLLLIFVARRSCSVRETGEWRVV